MDAEMEMCLIFVMVHEKMLNVLVSFGNHRAHSVLNIVSLPECSCKLIS